MAPKKQCPASPAPAEGPAPTASCRPAAGIFPKRIELSGPPRRLVPARTGSTPRRRRLDCLGYLGCSDR